MRRAREIFQRLFVLPPGWALLVSLPFFGLVIAVLSRGIAGPLAYSSYAGSAYALTVSVLALPKWIRAIRRWTERRLQNLARVEVGARYLSDGPFRTRVSLYMSLLVNLAYIALKLVSGMIYHSVWLLALGIYYILLAAMRLALVRHMDRHLPGENLRVELKRCRLCGLMLLLMNQALMGIVILMVRWDQRFDYPGVLIYAMAAYSFYAVIVAAVNLARSRRQDSPILSAVKAVNLVAAMVSILSLTTAMLFRFGEGDETEFRTIMTASVGGVVCTAVIVMAICMIAGASARLRALNDGRARPVKS